MAERRMFAKPLLIVMYFWTCHILHNCYISIFLCEQMMIGFINNPKNIMRLASCKEDDLKLLIAKQFILPFESGIVVIKHWKIHNYIRNDRYKRNKISRRKITATARG